MALIGGHAAVRSAFTIRNDFGGSASLYSVVFYAHSNSSVLLNGSVHLADDAQVAGLGLNETGWPVTNGMTLRGNSQLRMGSFSSITMQDENATYEIDSFSTLESSVTIDEGEVNCLNPGKVIALDLSGETPDGLCITDPP